METIRKYIVAGMVLLPGMVIAATDCRVIEYPDHYDAVCVGDEKPGPVRDQTAIPTQAPAAVQAPASQVPAAQAPSTTQVNTQVTAQAEAARVPVTIGQRRPDKALRDAARASRIRLMKEQQAAQ